MDFQKCDTYECIKGNKVRLCFVSDMFRKKDIPYMPGALYQTGSDKKGHDNEGTRYKWG